MHCHRRSVLLKAARSRPDGTVRSRPDAARSRPDTARNSTVERSERNKSHTNYMLTTFILLCTKGTLETEKNNVTSRYAETYMTINCKT